MPQFDETEQNDMPPHALDAEALQLATLLETLPPDVHERLKALGLHITLDQQRQRTQMEEELHRLREHLLTLTREERQQQQTLRETLRETIDELRKEVAEALQHLSQDMERVAQHAEAHTNRAVERLRNELLHTLVPPDHSLEQQRLLGELFVTLGRQLQNASRGEPA